MASVADVSYSGLDESRRGAEAMETSQTNSRPVGSPMPVDDGGMQAALSQFLGRLTPSRMFELKPVMALSVGYQMRICQVRTPYQFGTGFLIGPDTILTNYHVIRDIAGRDGNADCVRDTKVIFDYAADFNADVTPVRRVRLARRRWLTCFANYSDAEADGDFSVAPEEEALDFAVLRLDGRPGDDRVKLIDGETQRGWFDLRQAVPPPKPGTTVFIYHHSQGGPAKWSVGTCLASQWQTRIRYDANSEDGSSGGLVVDQDLRWVGLHHAAPDGWNQGIPLVLICRYLDAATRRAFVIQSVGEEDTDCRKRADNVLHLLIEPACRKAGYGAVRASDLTSEKLTEPIISSLSTEPLVIADLTGPWSLNVMLEIGFRIGTGKPILLIVDAQREKDLPLHLRDRRMIVVDLNKVGSAKDDLSARIQLRDDDLFRHAWRSQYAYVDFRLAPDDPTESVVTYANEAALLLYGYRRAEDIIGKSVEQADSQLTSYMSGEHKAAYLADQATGVAPVLELAQQDVPRQLEVFARVPIWLTRHPEHCQNGRVYLPILVHYKFDREQRAYMIRTAFLDITSWAAVGLHVDREKGVLRIPDMFQETARFEYDICLCYDINDRSAGMALRGLLAGMGFRVWPSATFSREDDCALSPDDAREALSLSHVAAVVIGQQGIGRWKDPGFAEAILEHCRVKQGKVAFRILLVGEQEWSREISNEHKEVLERCPFLTVTKNDTGQIGIAYGDFVWNFLSMVRDLIQL